MRGDNSITVLFFFRPSKKGSTVDSRHLGFALSRNRLSRHVNLVPVLTWKSNNR